MDLQMCFDIVIFHPSLFGLYAQSRHYRPELVDLARPTLSLEEKRAVARGQNQDDSDGEGGSDSDGNGEGHSSSANSNLSLLINDMGLKFMCR
jgi:hypothetical protein